VVDIAREQAMRPHHPLPDSYELHQWARRERSAAIAKSLAVAFKSLARALSVRDGLDLRPDALDPAPTHGPQRR
jgi:hypothetical protein